MILSKNRRQRDNEVEEIVNICCMSKRDREQLYLKRRKYFYYGTSDYVMDVKYNRAQSHLDLVSSFLFAPDHCRYSVSPPRNSSNEVVAQIRAVSDEWNDTFKDCGLAMLFSDSVLWSLVLNSMFLKLGWSNERKDLFAKVVYPQDFAVYDESEPDLDAQEAFVHTYNLNWDNAVQRLKKAGMTNQIKKLARYSGPYTEDLPPAFASMIIAQTPGGNLAGPTVGRANYDWFEQETYAAATEQPTVRFHEVYVWDDSCEDYVIFTKADGVDGCLSDSRQTIEVMRKADETEAAKLYQGESNLFGIEQEHPFVHICPYPLHDYFWGMAHMEGMIPLQRWTNERLQQISDLLEQNVDPPKIGSGMTGITDDKMEALGGPGTWVMDQIPNAQIRFERPPMVPDLFAEFKEIGAIFLERSGLTETMMGRGEQGVRSDRQAKHAVTTGSGRIRKVAVQLENPLVKLADVGLKLMRRNSTRRVLTDTGTRMVLDQLAETNYRIRVAGHSHSPLFADETKENALVMFKSQAIDREDLITMLDPPNREELVHKLRKRVTAEKQQKQQEMEAGVASSNKPKPHVSPHPKAAAA